MRLLQVTTLGTLLLLSGCASMPKDAGFGAVKSFSDKTLNHNVQWHTSDASYQEAAAWLTERLKTPLDIDTAIRIGLVYSPSLQAIYAEVGIAQANVVQASLLKNPGFTLGYMSNTHYHQSNFNLAISIADLITQPTRRHIATQQLEQKQLQVELAIIDFIAQTKKVYYSALAAGELAQVASKSEQSALAAAILASEQYKSGSLSLRETAGHQINHLQALNASKQAASTARIEHEALIAGLGLPQNLSQINLEGPLPELPKKNCLYSDIEAWALEHRLDIRIAQNKLNLLCDQLGFTRNMRTLGSLDLGIQNQNASGTGTTTGPTLALELPLFDQGKARIARAEVQVLQAQMILLDTVAQALSQVRTAQIKAQTAYESAYYYQQMMQPLADTMLRETQTRQGSMLASPYELLESFNNTQNIAQSALQSLYSYWGAHTEFERTAGGILPLSLCTNPPPAIDDYPLLLNPQSPVPEESVKPVELHHHMHSMPDMKM